MYSTRVNQGPFAPPLSPSVAALGWDACFDYSSSESLVGMALENVDWDSFPMAAPNIPVSKFVETNMESTVQSLNDFSAGPQMNFEEGLRQPVGNITITPIIAASGSTYAATQFDEYSLTGPTSFALSVPMDNSQDGTQVYDSIETSSADDSGPFDGDSNAKPRSICPTCGKSYSRPASLTRHVNSEHRSIRHQCSQCPKTYDRPEYVRRHEKSAHRKTSQTVTPYSPGPRTPQASASPRSAGVSKTRGRKAQQNFSLAKKIDRIREKYSLEIQRAIFEDMSQNFDLSGEDMDGLGEE